MAVDRPIKRQRKTLSCTFCKQRKVKCDKEKPCSACVRYGTAHLCSYESDDGQENVAYPTSQDLKARQEKKKKKEKKTTVLIDDYDNLSEINILKQKLEELENKANGNFDDDEFSGEPFENQADYLNGLGTNIYGSSKDRINFHKDYVSLQVKKSHRRINLGPFAWHSLVKKDSASRALFRSISELRAKELGNAGASYVKRDVGSNVEDLEMMGTPYDAQHLDKEEMSTNFREKELDTEGYNDMKPFIQARERKQEGRNAVNKSGITLGLALYEGELDGKNSLTEKVMLVLPKQKVLWLLVRRFFLHVYPFMPFVDEENFQATIEAMIGKEEYLDRPIVSLKIEKKIDFANAAILLLMVRLAYLSLFSNRLVVNEKNLMSNSLSEEALEVKYLLSNPVNIDVVQIAQLCLDQFDILGKNNIVIIQCSLIMRLYHMFGPEFGDGADGGDSQIYNGMLVQMAYSMGLNREPKFHAEILKDEKLNHIGRKIWLFLVLTDVVQAIQYGNPICIESKYCDTKLPFLENGNENIRDVELEKLVLGSFSYFKRFYVKVRRILDLALPVSNTVHVKELVNIMNDFEIFLIKNYGTLSDYLEPFQAELYHRPFLKISKCKNYLSCRNFNVTLLFYLFLYYEKKGNAKIAFYYFVKVFNSIYEGLVPRLNDLIYNNQISFGDSAALIMNPVIQQNLHKSLQILLSIFVRVTKNINSTEERGDDSPARNSDENSFAARLKNLQIVKRHVIKAVRIIYSSLTQLSRRYYYAWKICKANAFLISRLESEELAKYLVQEIQEPTLELSDSQVDVMIAICQRASSQLNDNGYAESSFSNVNLNLAETNGINSTFSFNSSSKGTSHLSDDLFARESVYTETPNTPSNGQPSMNLLEADIDKLWAEIETLKPGGSESFDFDVGPIDGVVDVWSHESLGSNTIDSDDSPNKNMDFLNTNGSDNFNFL